MPRNLSPSRLEAFSDGVIAVIITIMVLELKVPAHEISNVEGLRQTMPLILVYLLSFIQVGIYWVNHNYLVDDLEQITHGIMWANLALLFALSLIPWATNWVAERGISPFSVSLYGVACYLPAVTWFILAQQICKKSGEPLAGSTPLQIASWVLYLGTIPCSYISPYIGLGMISLVAILWLIPPKKIREKTRT